jgi:hypothetical protein
MKPNITLKWYCIRKLTGRNLVPQVGCPTNCSTVGCPTNCSTVGCPTNCSQHSLGFIIHYAHYHQVSLNNQQKYISKTSNITLHIKLTVVPARCIYISVNITPYVLHSVEGYSNVSRNV